MLHRKQRAHASRLLFVGAVMASIGLGLSLFIVIVRYPRYREICSVWSDPKIFDYQPNAKVETLDIPTFRGKIPFLGRPSVNATQVQMAGTDSDGNIYYQDQIKKWYVDTKCLEPSLYDVPSRGNPIPQKIVSEIKSDGRLTMHCCIANRLELYFPPTISESIRDWNAPEGRIFFGFMLIASSLVLLSFHPYNLSNVCSIHDMAFGIINTASLRHYIPPMGLMLVACVPTVPIEEMKAISPSWDVALTNFLMFCVHMCGAVGSFVGYAVAEVWALNILPESIDSLEDEMQDESDLLYHKQLHLGLQRPLRIIAVLSILGGCGIFSLGFTMVMFNDCQNIFVLQGTPLLALRLITYLSETCACFGLMASLLIIWYFSPERHQEVKIFRDPKLMERHLQELKIMNRDGYNPLYWTLPDMFTKNARIEELEQQFREKHLLPAGPSDDDNEVHYKQRPHHLKRRGSDDTSSQGSRSRFMRPFDKRRKEREVELQRLDDEERGEMTEGLLG